MPQPPVGPTRGSCHPSAACDKHRFPARAQEQRSGRCVFRAPAAPVSRRDGTVHLALGFPATSGFTVEGKRQEVGISGT